MITTLIFLGDKDEQPIRDFEIDNSTNFEWWYIIAIIVLWVLGLWFNDYIRENKHKNLK